MTHDRAPMSPKHSPGNGRTGLKEEAPVRRTLTLTPSNPESLQFYLNGKKKHQFAGGDLNGLQQWTRKLAGEAERNNV